MMLIDTPERYLKEAEEKFGLDANAAKSAAMTQDAWSEPLLSAACRFAIDAMTAMHVSYPAHDLAAAIWKTCDARGTFRPSDDQSFPTCTAVVSQVRSVWTELGFDVTERTARTARLAVTTYYDMVLANVSANIRLKNPTIMDELNRAKLETGKDGPFTDKDILLKLSPRKDPKYDDIKRAVLACADANGYDY